MKNKIINNVVMAALFFYTQSIFCADADDSLTTKLHLLNGKLHLREILLNNRTIRNAVMALPSGSYITFDTSDAEDTAIRKYLSVYKKNKNPSAEDMQTACIEALESITQKERLDGTLHK